jgi:hypothetical protein
MKVLVIPEDPTHNGYILQPLVKRIMNELGRKVSVQVLTNPKLGGYDHVKNAIRKDQRLIKWYRHYDLWLFLPDGDRATGLDRIEEELQSKDINLICCAAVPKVEIWLLAGHLNKISISWKEAREHPRLKEDVFEPFIAEFGQPQSAGQGRRELIRETLSNYRGLLSRCPELKLLQDKIENLICRR